MGNGFFGAAFQQIGGYVHLRHPSGDFCGNFFRIACHAANRIVQHVLVGVQCFRQLRVCGDRLFRRIVERLDFVAQSNFQFSEFVGGGGRFRHYVAQPVGQAFDCCGTAVFKQFRDVSQVFRLLFQFALDFFHSGRCGGNVFLLLSQRRFAD